MTEVRRPSVLRGDLACSPAVNTGCQRTLFTYDATCKTLRVDERGWTFAQSADVNPVTDADSFCHRTERCYDTLGRPVQEVGPQDCTAPLLDCAAGSTRGTRFYYWPAADPEPLRRLRLQEVRRFPDPATPAVYVSERFEHYDSAGYPIETTDGNGAATTRTYVAGRPGLVQSTSVGGQTTTVFYDAAERIDRIRRPAANEVDHQYAAAGGFERLSALVESNGESRRFTYHVSAAGVSAGNVASERTLLTAGTVSAERSFGYTQHLLSSETHDDNSGHTVSRQTVYDAIGRPVAERLPDGGTLRRTFDGLGRLSTESRCAPVSPGVGCVPTECGQPTCPSVATTSYGYDAHGNLASMTSAEGRTTSYTHDDAGRLVRIQAPDAALLASVFGARGQIVETLQDTATRTFGYDDLGRLTRETASMTPATIGPFETLYTYDVGDAGANANGRLAQVEELRAAERTRLTKLAYDPQGRVTSESRELIAGSTTTIATTSYAWTPNGRLASITYPVSGAVVTFPAPATDPDRPASVQRDSVAVASALSYFPFEPAIRSATLGGVVSLGRERLLDGRWSRVHAYTTAGTLLDRGVVYDDVARTQSRTEATELASGGDSATWSYGLDPLGRLTSTTFPDFTKRPTPPFSGMPGSLTYGYDDDGNRASEVRQMPDGSAFNLSHCYYAGTNRLRDIVDPPSGSARPVESVNHASARGAWEQLLVDLRQDMTERRETLNLGNLFADFRSRLDAYAARVAVDAQRLLQQIVRDPDLRQALFNLLRHRQGRIGGLDQEDLRLLRRLLATLASFDIVAAIERARLPDPDCAAAADRFGYDSRGNVVSDALEGFCNVYDDRGRLFGGGMLDPAATPAGCADFNNVALTAGYDYDFRGHRVQEYNSLAGHLFFDSYDLDGRLISRMASADPPVPFREYVYLGGEPLAQVELGRLVRDPVIAGLALPAMLGLAVLLVGFRRRRLATGLTVLSVTLLVCSTAEPVPAVTRYYVNDGLGTPLRLLQVDSGIVHAAWSAEYAPFGEVYPGVQEVEQPLRFPGQYDDGAGLGGPRYQNWHRDYAPAWGRYAEVDPLVVVDPGNDELLPYAYALNNPLRYTDPTGLAVWLCRRLSDISLRGPWFGVQHHWIKTDACETGMGRPAGQGGSEVPFVQTSTVPHFGQSALPSARCERQPNADESCVNRQICLSIYTGRWSPWNQCQSWASDVLSRCQRCSTPGRRRCP